MHRAALDVLITYRLRASRDDAEEGALDHQIAQRETFDDCSGQSSRPWWLTCRCCPRPCARAAWVSISAMAAAVSRRRSTMWSRRFSNWVASIWAGLGVFVVAWWCWARWMAVVRA
jgi:hypothetical protein